MWKCLSPFTNNKAISSCCCASAVYKVSHEGDCKAKRYLALTGLIKMQSLETTMNSVERMSRLFKYMFYIKKILFVNIQK